MYNLKLMYSSKYISWVYLVKYGVFGDFSAKMGAKPPGFLPFLYITGGLEVLFDFCEKRMTRLAIVSI